MKRLLLVVWACYAPTFLTYGQNLTLTGGVDDPIAAVQHVLSNIDQSPVTSHVLLDKTLPVGRVSEYGATALSDSTYCHMWLLDMQFTNLLTASLPSYPYTANILDYQTEWDAYVVCQ